MEAAYDLVYRKWTGCKDVFQPAVSTSREQQATCVQSQLMTEIILNILPLRILHEEMLITFRHRMNVRYVRYDIDVIVYASAMLHH